MTGTQDPRVLLDRLVFPESARWHADRLWFAHWGAGQIIAVGADGASEIVGTGPVGYGWSIDWLPDGSLLTTGPRVTRVAPDETASEYGDLGSVASHAWNEIVVGRAGDVYVNGFEFDMAGGGAPKPGIIALVHPDGTTRQVANDLQFPNGMAISNDGSTLIVSESFAARLTAFDITSDGDLTARRTWAEGIAPDGISMDAAGAIWCGAADIQMMTGDPTSAGGALIRVLEGGDVTDRVETDRPVFSCVLGGPTGTTLYMLAREWDGFDRVADTDARLTGRVLTHEVDVPADAAAISPRGSGGRRLAS
jgi:sugar lactone lactonase YvrE